MSRTHGWRWRSGRALVPGMVVLGLVLSCSSAQRGNGSGGDTERFTAFAVNLGSRGAVSGGQAGTVEIAIDRWSTPEETARLVQAFRDGGSDELLETLRDTRPVGYIRTPDRIGWDLHYAVEAPAEDGGRRIFLATDRPIGFWEAVNQTESLEYPFTLVEIRLGADGEGEGRMSIATQITASSDGRYLQLENYTTEPVRLQQVRRRS